MKTKNLLISVVLILLSINLNAQNLPVNVIQIDNQTAYGVILLVKNLTDLNCSAYNPPGVLYSEAIANSVTDLPLGITAASVDLSAVHANPDYFNPILFLGPPVVYFQPCGGINQFYSTIEWSMNANNSLPPIFLNLDFSTDSYFDPTYNGGSGAYIKRLIITY
jgi:hypothetical protein